MITPEIKVSLIFSGFIEIKNSLIETKQPFIDTEMFRISYLQYYNANQPFHISRLRYTRHSR